MGELTEKLKGAANEVVGDVKEALGKNTNNPDLAAEGAAQNTVGKGQKVKGAVEGALGNDI